MSLSLYLGSPDRSSSVFITGYILKYNLLKLLKTELCFLLLIRDNKLYKRKLFGPKQKKYTHTGNKLFLKIFSSRIHLMKNDFLVVNIKAKYCSDLF